MRLEERIYRRLLREAVPDLGKIQFSPDREDGVPRSEPNTPAEQDLYDAIGEWVESGNPQILCPHVDSLRSLIDDRRYGMFFKHPKSMPLYRGLSNVPSETIEGWLQGDENRAALRGFRQDYTGELNCNFMLKNVDCVSSWSYDQKIAKRFSRTRDLDSRCANIVLMTKRDVNPGVFIDLEEIQKKVPSLGVTYGTTEREVLALGDVVVTQIIWSSL